MYVCVNEKPKKWAHGEKKRKRGFSLNFYCGVGVPRASYHLAAGRTYLYGLIELSCSRNLGNRSCWESYRSVQESVFQD